jgi:hypothetical protein
MPCLATLLCCAQPFAKLPVPEWQLGKPVELASVTSVADSYFKALEPARKLRTPALPAQVSEQLAQLGKSMGSDGADLKVSRCNVEVQDAVMGLQGWRLLL